jgi:hypothetical protein
MTMPHLSNCPHDGDGWCIDCVKAMHSELERMTELNTLYKELTVLQTDLIASKDEQIAKYEDLVKKIKVFDTSKNKKTVIIKLKDNLYAER